MTNQELHLKTKSVAERYLKTEAELVSLLIEMDSRRAFRDLGYASLFQYCVLDLKLSEAVTSAFITVSRKAAQVPDLMDALEVQTLSVSKAAKIVSALDSQNPMQSQEVIQFATQHSTAQTERWLRDQKGIENQYSLKIGSKTMELLKKARSLARAEGSLEDALVLALEFYIEKQDPLKKAERSETRALKKKNTVYPVLSNASSRETRQPIISKAQRRKPIPAQIKHQVILRDHNQCAHEIRPGLTCGNKKYLEIHHIKPVSQGGSNQIANLKLLCSSHHKLLHDN